MIKVKERLKTDLNNILLTNCDSVHFIGNIVTSKSYVSDCPPDDLVPVLQPKLTDPVLRKPKC